METSLKRYIVSTSAAALLAGCGGSQLPVGIPGAMPQSRIASMLDRSGARVLPDVKTGATPEYNVTGPLVYVTNYTNNDVTVHHALAKDPAPVANISATLNSPSGDCLDGHGTLYVTNQPASGPGWITEYALGRTAPSGMITDGINTPAFCAIDSVGNLWVTNIGGPNVTEYLYGSTKPHTVITTGLVYPVGVAIDHSGNLYVANRPVSGSANVLVYAPGNKTPSRTITDGVTYPVGIGTDSSSTLYVTNATSNNVEEYLSGQGHPYRTVTQALNDPADLVLNKKGWLYVANFGNSNNVVEFPLNSLTPSRRRISKGVVAPEGVAYFPPVLP
jgi:hypothetical protein